MKRYWMMAALPVVLALFVASLQARETFTLTQGHIDLMRQAVAVWDPGEAGGPVVAFYGANLKEPQADVAGERSIDYRTRVWSDTRPAINLTHIFAGEINRREKPVGFHSRPNGIDPAGSGIMRFVDPPNRAGVYTAAVWIGRRNRTKFSSFFPDRLSRFQVIQAILSAFYQGRRRGESFRGPSGRGFTIEGYFQNGRINSAYPLYAR